MTSITNIALKENYEIYKSYPFDKYIAVSPKKVYKTSFFSSISDLIDDLQKNDIIVIKSDDPIKKVKLDYVCTIRDLYRSHPEYFI
jgi:hypothetical protein